MILYTVMARPESSVHTPQICLVSASAQRRSALEVYNIKVITQFRLPAETRSSYGRNRNLAETTNLASFGAVTETETEIWSVSTGN